MDNQVWLAIRDGIGNQSSVHYKGRQVPIRNLRARLYDVYIEGNCIDWRVDPNTLPGKILDYIISSKDFNPECISTMVRGLNISLKDSEPEG